MNFFQIHRKIWDNKVLQIIISFLLKLFIDDGWNKLLIKF